MGNNVRLSEVRPVDFLSCCVISHVFNHYCYVTLSFRSFTFFWIGLTDMFYVLIKGIIIYHMKLEGGGNLFLFS